MRFHNTDLDLVKLSMALMSLKIQFTELKLATNNLLFLSGTQMFPRMFMTLKVKLKMGICPYLKMEIHCLPRPTEQ